jgi:hypothetical protein
MDEYLAWDAWSKSEVAAMMVSPEYCRWYREEREQKETDATAFGTLAHTRVLEPHLWPPRGVAFIDGPMNKNPWKREADDAKARGWTPTNAKVREYVEALAARLVQDTYIGALLDMSDGEREVAAVARCPVTGLLLKARCDLRVPKLRIIGDLKTTGRGTDPWSWERMIWEYSYWMGAPHYVETFGLAEGREYENFLFLLVGQEPPFLPRIYHLDPLTLEAGRDTNHLLRRKIVRCLQSGEWPASESRIDTCGLGPYRLNQVKTFLEEEINACPKN